MMKYCRWLWLSLLCLLLAACQTIEQAKVSLVPLERNLFFDEQYPGFQHVPIETETAIFASSDDMQLMVQEKLLPERDMRKRTTKLLRQIFTSRNLDLSYSSNANLTAEQSYKNRVANCLSLTILAYTLAKDAGMNVFFQQVNVPEYWVRNGDYNMLTGHVNILVLLNHEPLTVVAFGSNSMQIDFDPYVAKKSFPKKIITRNKVLAMFYNNKGAQAMVDGEFDTAYAYLKASIIADPGFSSAWGNLGLLYRLSDHNDMAEQTYRHAVNIDQENLTAMTNLLVLLRATHGGSDSKEMADINKFITDKRKENPYYHALLADEAIFAGDYFDALTHYQDAIALDDKVHEFYSGMARVYFKLGKISKAKRAIKKAIVLNHVPDIDEQYIAKLNFLKKVALAN